MSDGTELSPVEFDLEPTITFNAKDVITHLSPLQVVTLIKELDTELNEWEATVLLASYFGGQMREAPPETVAKNDEELAAALLALEEVPE